MWLSESDKSGHRAIMFWGTLEPRCPGGNSEPSAFLVPCRFEYLKRTVSSAVVDREVAHGAVSYPW